MVFVKNLKKMDAIINEPMVSVFMPVYNQERYICAALDSVLTQNYPNFEIVISDDCSIDSTPLIVKNYADKFPEKIKFYKLSDKNLGGDKHFELLLQKCRGDYVCMFAGDDIMYPKKISNQMSEILKFNLSCHGHSVDCIDKDGIIFSEISNANNKFFFGNKSLILNGVPAAASSWIVKKEFVSFNPTIGFLHDFDMIIKVLKNGRVGYMSNQKLGAYRITSASWSRNLKMQDYLMAYTKLLLAWIKSKMYLESFFLIVRVLIKITTKIYKFIKNNLIKFITIIR